MIKFKIDSIPNTISSIRATSQLDISDQYKACDFTIIDTAKFPQEAFYENLMSEALFLNKLDYDDCDGCAFMPPAFIVGNRTRELTPLQRQNIRETGFDLSPFNLEKFLDRLFERLKSGTGSLTEPY